MKLLVKVLLLCVLFSSSLPVMASAESESPIKVYFDGDPMSFEVDPVLIEDTTMVQFRAIFEKLGMTVSWEPRAKRIEAKGTNTYIVMYLGNKSVSINGAGKVLEVPPTLVNESTMVPLRVVSEASGRLVKWDGETRSVSIEKGYEKLFSGSTIGEETFLTSTGVKGFPSQTTNIYEKDGYTYVTWYKDVTIDKANYTTFYVSIAKDNKWVNKEAVVFSLVKNTGVSYSYLFSNGSYYIKADKTITKVDLNEKGYDSGTIVANVYSTKPTDSLRPISVDGKPSMMLKSTGSNYIFSPEDTSYVALITDTTKYVDSAGLQTQMYYNSESKILHLLEPSGYRKFDTTKGMFIYASDGKTLTYKYSNTIPSGTVVPSNGKFYYIYNDGSGRNLKISEILPDMSLGEAIPIELSVPSFQNRTVLVSPQQIRIFNTSTFNGDPSIQLDLYSR